MNTRFDLRRPRTALLAAFMIGILAGLVAAAYLSIVGEPAIEEAIAIEEAAADDAAPEPSAASTPGADHGDDEVTVSREVQKGIGLFAAYGLTGGAFGLLLGVAVLSLRGPVGDHFRRSLVAATILAGAITVVPWLKYPPNPPAVGDPATAGDRQRLYVLLITMAGVVLAGAAHLSRRLREARWPESRRVVMVGVVVVAVLGLVVAVMPPPPDAISPDVPAALIWRFRVASLGGNLLLWGLLAVGFGLLGTESAGRRETERQNSMPFNAETPAS